MESLNIIITVLCHFIMTIALLPPKFNTELLNVKHVQNGGESGNFHLHISITFLLSSCALAYKLIYFEMDFINLLLAILVLSFGSLRLWCYALLNDKFTYNLVIKQDHELITRGPYKYLIHPSYTGQIGMMFTYILFTKAYILLIPFFIMAFIKLPKRIQLEEQMMTSEFGEKYIEYCKMRYRMIPYIW